MTGRAPTLRLAALIASATLAVHELRFLLAPGSSGGAPVAGHSYLPLAGLLVAFGLALACAQLARRIDAARRTGCVEGALRFREAWLIATVALVAIFAAQELLEGALAGGRATGLAAVVGEGAWIALPLSGLLGALVALATTGARAIVAAAARRAVPVLRHARRQVLGYARRERRPSLTVLAGYLAGRSPPARV